jgi:hypothetical protein
VTTSPDCERVRIALMAALDGEPEARTDPHADHLAACDSCRTWLQDLQGLAARFQGAAYPNEATDLWPAVAGRIHQSDDGMSLPRRLWPIAGIVVAWRAAQLFVDLPLPVLHPIVPLVAAIVTVRLVAGDPLAIETSAPELQNRGA